VHLFKTSEKKVSCGAPWGRAPLLVKNINNALCLGAPLVFLKKKTFVTNGAPWVWCAISVYHTIGAPTHGAPLLYSSGAPSVWCAIIGHIIYSPFASSGESYLISWPNPCAR
jgi:hypothetical protein